MTRHRPGPGAPAARARPLRPVLRGGLLPAALACLLLLLCGLASAEPLSLEETVRAAAREPLGAGATAVGSGVFISPTHILTSAHVVAGCQTIVVTGARIGPVPARVVLREPRRDSAVLSVAEAQPAFLALARPARPSAGAALSILGFPAARAGRAAPLSEAAAFDALVTDRAGLPLLRMKTAAGPGLSGAPVLDASGALLGILVGRLDARPSDVVALSATGLSDAALAFFAKVPGANAPAPPDAVVKIHCR